MTLSKKDQAGVVMIALSVAILVAMFSFAIGHDLAACEARPSLSYCR